MTVRIIHTADTHLRADEQFDMQTPNDLFDTFEELVSISKQNLELADESALVHTGDVFDDPEPPEDIVNRVIELCNSYTAGADNPPRLLFIAGNHDATENGTPALDRVINETDAEYLTQSPTILGNNDIALYGVHEYENERLLAGDLSFESPPQGTPTALCIHGNVGKDRSQEKVNYLSTITSIPELNDLVSFQWSMILSGHIHKPCYGSHEGTTRFYPGAPDRVRSNLKDTVPRTVNHFEIQSHDAKEEGKFDYVATRARPWLEFVEEITKEMQPQNIVDNVISRWKAFVQYGFSQLEDEWVLLYDKDKIRQPTIDIELHGRGNSDVPTDFAFSVVDGLKEWGHAHAIRVQYDIEDGPASAVIGSGNVGRLGPKPPKQID